jgi:sensor domain CHASE-containing protein
MTAGAGAVATMAANYAINHDNKNKSDELLAARQDLKAKYKTVTDKIIDECNKNIQSHKDLVASLDKNDDEIREYVKAVNAAKPITNISEILTSPFCR